MDTPLAKLLLTIGAIAGLMAGALVAYALLLIAGRVMRTRGYSPLAIGLVAFFSVVLGGAFDAWLFHVLGGEWLAAVAGFTGFLLGTPLLMVAVAYVLPYRNQRRAGERVVRFPLHIALYVLAALCAAGVLGLLSLPMFFGTAALRENVSAVIMLFLGLTVGLFVAAKRVRKQIRSPRIAAEAMQADPRAPVLYLREFAHEKQPFIKGGLSEMRPYLARARRWMPEFLWPEWSAEVTVTMEDYLLDAVERALGPLVALGSPEDYLQPLGAAREYAADSNWQQRFEALAAKACAVLLVPGTSNHLTWELTTLLRRGHANKLFIMIGPVTFEPSSLWIVGKLYGWQQAQWPAYRQLMETAGYTMPADCPRPCSIMGFDRSGRATLISNGGALSPDVYVHAIETHLLRQGYRQKVSVPLLDYTLGDSAGGGLEQAYKRLELYGLAESASFAREALLVLAICLFPGLLVHSTIEMVPGLRRYAFGFGGTAEAYYVLMAVGGALCGAFFVGKGVRLKAAISGAVAGVSALFVMTFFLVSATELNEGLFFLLGAIGVLPGVGLFLLLDRSSDEETSAPALPAMPMPQKGVGWTCSFDYPGSLDNLVHTLNTIGPWTWTLRKNARHGSYLSCRPQSGVRARIHRRSTRCVGLLQFDQDTLETRMSVEREFAEIMQKAGIEIIVQAFDVGHAALPCVRS